MGVVLPRAAHSLCIVYVLTFRPPNTCCSLQVDESGSSPGVGHDLHTGGDSREDVVSGKSPLRCSGQ